MADFILLTHILFVVFVVAALPAIWVGAHYRRAWARSIALRGVHLAAILIVAAESLLGMVCPLTEWEYLLRGERSELGFIQRALRELLYWDLPGWFFTVIYCGFALLVIWTWLRIPPQRRR